MGFITDTYATKIAKRILSEEEFADFEHCRDRMRHFEDCLASNTSSPLCKFTDSAENLDWCRLGLMIESASFEDYLQRIIPASECQ
jgi:hypothetical protein